jgi:hypothetical protein
LLKLIASFFAGQKQKKGGTVHETRNNNIVVPFELLAGTNGE